MFEYISYKARSKIINKIEWTAIKEHIEIYPKEI